MRRWDIGRLQHVNVAWLGILYALLFLTLATSWGAVRAHGGLYLLGLPASVVQPLSHMDTFSEKLVRGSLEQYIRHGDAELGGFMLAFQEDVHIAAVKAIDGPDVTRDLYPYISNFNFQYDLAKVFADVAGLSPYRTYLLTRLFAGVAMAITVALICVGVQRMFTFWHGIAVLAVFFCSTLLLERATASYWLIFFMFLPFLATLWFYQRCREPQTFPILLGLIGILVFLKSLTGYEYLSNIALGAALPMVYWELKNAQGFKLPVLRRLFVRSLLIGVAAVLGFVAAAGFHIGRAAAFFADWGQGVEAILLPFQYSTMGSETDIRGSATAGEYAHAWARTFLLYNWPINTALILATLWILWNKLVQSRSTSEPATFTGPALLITLVLALVATLSWSFLALKHSLPHAHINWLQMYLFFYIYAAIACAEFWPQRQPATANERLAPGTA